MSLQLLALAIYNVSGESRVIRFDLGKVNIITGASKTGKTALIDIVDYCLGRNDFTIPSGVIRDKVTWYVLHVQLPSGQAVIGRPAPTGGASTTTDVFLEVGGDLALPAFAALRRTTNSEALADFLTEAVGISANENVPSEGQSRSPLQANIKHARFLLFQPQYRIADRNMMFFRQEEPFVPQAIKDSLPYFLGATGDDQFDRLQKLRRAKRDLKLLERRLADEESVRGQDNSRAASILTEARNVGLVGPVVGAAQGAEAVEILRGLLSWTPAQTDSPQGTSLTTLQQARDALLTEYRTIQNEIEAARSFAAAEDEFGVEASDQKHRLAAINLFPTDPVVSRCPICEHELNSSVPKAEAIRNHLASLEKQMAATTRQRPRLEAYIAEKENRQSQLRQELTESKASIEALIAQEEVLQQQRNRVVEQARVVGRLSLFFDSLLQVDDGSALQLQVGTLRSRVADLEAGLSEDLLEDQLNSMLQVIGRTMSEWAKRLDLEHSESPIGFDMKNLTVIAYRESGPIRMSQMGSGENWMGYHVITHLALQKWFAEKNRPVPGLLMLDQPTQVYFPSEPKADRSLDELADDDRAAVKRLFEFIFDVTASLYPKLQVIITDHADLNEGWFQDSVKERWRSGVKLVPASWYEDDASMQSETTPASDAEQPQSINPINGGADGETIGDSAADHWVSGGTDDTLADDGRNHIQVYVSDSGDTADHKYGLDSDPPPDTSIEYKVEGAIEDAGGEKCYEI